MLAVRDTDLVRAAAVARAAEVIRANPAGPHPLRELARAARYSPFHFHRIFREVTGLTPASYLTAVRMAHARRLLVCSSLQVAQVSRETGYRSLAAFTSQFSRTAGVSPQRFRNLMGTMQGVPVGALLPALSTDAPVPGGDQQLAVTLSGELPGPALLLAGLLPTGSLGAGPHWQTHPRVPDRLSLPAPPRDGAYAAFLVLLPASACLVEALVDQVGTGLQIGAAEVRFPPHQGHVAVRMRQPRRTDPPVLATAPVRWLAHRAVELAGAPRPSRVPAEAGSGTAWRAYE